MAEGTRMKSLEEHIRRLEQLQQDQARSIAENAQRLNQWMESSNETTKAFQLEFEGQRVRAEALQEKIGEVDSNLRNFQMNIEQRIANLTDMVRNSNRFHEQEHARGSANSGTETDLGQRIPAPHQATSRQYASGNIPTLDARTNQDRSRSVGMDAARGNIRLPKLDFPAFEGIHPRSWVRKSEKYFSIFSIPEGQKVELALMFLNGRADVWAQGFVIQNPRVDWGEFSEALCARFGEKQGTDIVEEFNKLVQKGDVEEYTEKFEELRSYLLSSNPFLPEPYFVASYISGLKEEIRSLVKLSQPTTIAHAFEQARLHQGAVQAILKLSKQPTSSSWRSYPNNPSSSASKPHFDSTNPSFNPAATSSSASSNVPTKATSQNVNTQFSEYRRTHGLCYKCGDKYFVGHQCKTSSLHSLLSSEIDDVCPADCTELITTAVRDEAQQKFDNEI